MSRIGSVNGIAPGNSVADRRVSTVKPIAAGYLTLRVGFSSMQRPMQSEACLTPLNPRQVFDVLRMGSVREGT
jgi:hypothetical protein